jgi:glycosyltransferase involved in cell wall biosynthesis
VDVQIVTTRRHPDAPAHTPQDVPVAFATGGAYAFAQTLRDRIQRFRPHVIHDHGTWLPTNGITAWQAWRADTPRVLTPRGMLEPWAMQHQRFKKAVAWYGYQRVITQRADLIHSTAPMEAHHLRELGVASPMAVIPNGVALPERWPDPVPCTSGRRALFLSRIHPKKGLPMLLRAWNALSPSGWTLSIVGPDEDGHRVTMEQLADRLGIADDVTFVGPVDDVEKWAWYRGSDLFVLPTHSENFGVVVAEALAAGLPVVTTQGAPWRVLEEEGCGWWVAIDDDALYDALAEAIALSDADRTAMGQHGRDLVHQRFTWPQIASQMKAAYQWLLGDGAPPRCITQEGHESIA